MRYTLLSNDTVNTMRKFVSVLLLSLATTAYAAQPAPGINAAASQYRFKSTEDARRFSVLTNETRCVVCQFQNIAESGTPIAESLRNKIYQLINQNKTDTEIRAYLVKRYGEVVLLKPRFNPVTAVLWFFPLIAISLFGLFLLRFWRRGLNNLAN